MPWFQVEGKSLNEQEIRGAVERLLDEARKRVKRDLKRVLLLPPDLTRARSGAGRITEMLWEGLKGCEAGSSMGMPCWRPSHSTWRYVHSRLVGISAGPSWPWCLSSAPSSTGR